MPSATAIDYATLNEPALVDRMLLGDLNAIRLLTTRNNQRLYRAAWSILNSRAEAEEAVQEGYLKAFANLSSFRGESSLATWLTRIVVNEALSKRRATARREKALEDRGVASIEAYREAVAASSRSPEGELMRRQFASMLETAIAALPETFRVVFVLREVEGMSIAETAGALGLGEPTVKTRLFRAKERLRAALKSEIGGALVETCLFAGADCQAMTARVVEKLAERSNSDPRSGNLTPARNIQGFASLQGFSRRRLGDAPVGFKE